MITGRKYRGVKKMIEAKEIVLFEEMFEHIKKTNFAGDIRKHAGRFNKTIANPEKLTAKKIYEISQTLELEPELVFRLIINQYLKNIADLNNNNNEK
jgi:hypothetical protein